MKKYLKNLHNALYAEKSQEYMFLALCTSIFVYGFMYRIISLQTVFWISIPFVVYYIFENKEKNPFDIDFLLITVATLIIANIAYMREPWLNMMWSDVRLVFVFPMVYLLGNACIGNNSNKSEKRSFYAITALSVGMFLQAVLDHINRYFRPMPPEAGRAWYSFWKDDYEVSTVFDIGFLIIVSGLYYAIKNRKKNRTFFVITLIGCVVSVYFSLETQGRTTLLMMVVVFLLCLVIDLITKVKVSKTRFPQIGKPLILFGILLIGAGVLYILNAFGIKTVIKESSIMSRDGGVLHNIRFTLAKDALKKTILYPEGGWEGGLEGGTHNSWFEFAKAYNTFVFEIIVLYVLNTLWNTIRLAIKGKNDGVQRFYIIGAVVSMFIYMTIEPVGAFPSYYYIVFFIFISGIANEYKRIVL